MLLTASSATSWAVQTAHRQSHQNLATQNFGFAFSGFKIHALALRRSGWPGWPACFPELHRLLNKFFQPLQCIVLVRFQSTKSLCLNNNDTFFTNPLVTKRHQSFFVERREAGILDIKSQMNGRCDLIYILAAWSLSTNLGNFNLPAGQFNSVG